MELLANKIPKAIFRLSNESKFWGVVGLAAVHGAVVPHFQYRAAALASGHHDEDTTVAFIGVLLYLDKMPDKEYY